MPVLLRSPRRRVVAASVVQTVIAIVPTIITTLILEIFVLAACGKRITAIVGGRRLSFNSFARNVARGGPPMREKVEAVVSVLASLPGAPRAPRPLFLHRQLRAGGG